MKELLSLKKIKKPFLILLLVAIPLIALCIIQYGKSFLHPKLNFEEIREFQGVYFNLPKPMLVIDAAYLPEGLSPEALLVGNDELDANSIVEEVKSKKGEINGKRVRLKGRIAYGDKKVIIELTEKENAFLYIENELTYPNRQTPPKPVTLKGKIIDPKCWFGTMVNNEREIHKTCATQSINEGIPPILKVDYNGKDVYYIIDIRVEKTSQTSLLAYVATPIQVKGQVYYQNGWNVLQTSINQISYLNE